MKKGEFILSRLLSYAEHYRWYTYMGMVLSGISTIVSLLPYVLIWLCVRELFISDGVENKAVYYAFWALLTAVLGLLIYVIALLCTHKAAFRIATNLRVAAMAHLMKLPLGYFNTSSSGRLRRNVQDSVSQTETFLAHQLPDLVGAYLTPIAVLGLIFAIDWKLGLISIIPVIIGFVFQGVMMSSNEFKEKINMYQESLTKMNSDSVEYVRGIPIVKTFGQSIFSFKKLYNTIEEYRNFVILYTKMFSLPMCLYQTFLGCIPLFLVAGGLWLFGDAVDPKAFLLDFIFYIFISPVFTIMMARIMWTSQDVFMAQNSLDTVDIIFAENPLPQGKEEKFPANTDIKLTDVSFAYNEAKSNVLTDVSLEVKQGTTVALVGVSGGGKSTIAALMARFWDVQKGAVTIGGVNVRDIAQDELMKNISFVFQNTKLYKSSILDNVREGRPEASEVEVMAALKAACCTEIIDRLPEGIHTIVGKNGVYFSGGEAQRIAIARAILKDAPIILLDEATAFTDPENEYQIQQALSALSKDKTVVIVAHRLSTIINVDKICVVEGGRIIESGSHQELLNAKNKYSQMWNEYKSAFSWNNNR